VRRLPRPDFGSQPVATTLVIVGVVDGCADGGEQIIGRAGGVSGGAGERGSSFRFAGLGAADQIDDRGRLEQRGELGQRDKFGRRGPRGREGLRLLGVELRAAAARFGGPFFDPRQAGAAGEGCRQVVRYDLRAAGSPRVAI
jgi:hypothetical protein